MECTKVDFEALARDRDQLWAEAFHLYQQGEACEPTTPEEVAMFAQETAQRTHQDAWEAKIAAGLTDVNTTTVQYVIETILEIKAKDLNPRSQNTRIASILPKLGFIRSTKKELQPNGSVVYTYHRAGAPKPVEIPGRLVALVEDLKREGFVLQPNLRGTFDLVGPGHIYDDQTAALASLL